MGMYLMIPQYLLYYIEVYDMLLFMQDIIYRRYKLVKELCTELKSGLMVKLVK